MSSPKERYLRPPADPQRGFPAFGPPQGDGMPLIISRGTVRMAEVLRLLEADAGHALSVTELAARTHLSVNQFRRVFHRATGTAPGAYRLQRALLRGASLLRDRGVSVKATARATGFHDTSHFTRLFRRHLGVKPSEDVPAP